MNKILVGALCWVVALAMPLFLLLSAARILINDWYPRYEYTKADFPKEVYGWTPAERLELALPSIHFLNSPLPPEQAVQILAAQHHPGTNSLLFTPNELSHMVDVKRLTDRLWQVHLVSAILVVLGLALLLAQRSSRAGAYAALLVGGLLTAALLFFLAIFVVAGFDTFFVQFHEVFFPQGNWTFDYSDSLIRLFPEKFWFDAGFMIAGGTLLAGIVVGGLGWLLGRRAGQDSAAAATETRPARLAKP